jgi:hypothetical protein
MSLTMTFQPMLRMNLLFFVQLSSVFAALVLFFKAMVKLGNVLRHDKDEARQGNARLCLFEGDSNVGNLSRQDKTRQTKQKARQAITTQGTIWQSETILHKARQGKTMHDKTS